jgi:ABC-type proline/glycine betaine transport system ATPase subunit
LTLIKDFFDETDDPDEAALLGDEILLLDQGRVLQSGETEMIFARTACEQNRRAHTRR